jgi:hypothetical protein
MAFLTSDWNVDHQRHWHIYPLCPFYGLPYVAGGVFPFLAAPESEVAEC